MMVSWTWLLVLKGQQDSRLHQGDITREGDNKVEQGIDFEEMKTEHVVVHNFNRGSSNKTSTPESKKKLRTPTPRVKDEVSFASL